MSILIQGMEMPKSFDHLFVGENLAGDLFVRNDTQEGDDVVWYPLIEVPPHGRLIDADELLTSNGVGTKIAGWGKMYHETCIEYAPTIIPADKEG